MAKNTSKTLSHQVIYQVYHRNFSNEGTFKGVEKHLDRLVDLGIDIVYLLPIHPIGEVARKGVLGSPYSISDFYGVNKELGTLDDLKSLIDSAHNRGLKVMMDIVFNHTSKDHAWLKEHPEYYYRNSEGKFSNRVGEWSDITDLDYTYKPLWNVMHDILVYWAEFGFDGYRCDVASFVPVDFWIEAREKVSKVNQDFIWLAETVHKEFVKEMRDFGFECHSDSEMFQAFDINYDYDIFNELEGYLKGESDLSLFIDRLNLQDVIYPSNYLKARMYENHDVPRLMKLTKSVSKTKNWVAAVFMLKGVAFLNGGIETLSDKLPNLFEKDPIDWTKINHDWVKELKTLIALKKRPIFSQYSFYEVVDQQTDVLFIKYEKDEEILISLCNVGLVKKDIQVPLEDGDYLNEFNQKTITVRNHMLSCDDDPIIIHKH
jgi:cyclomaltodextrinase / maltogenic alpha-amylase / neopullulanase